MLSNTKLTMINELGDNAFKNRQLIAYSIQASEQKYYH